MSEAMNNLTAAHEAMAAWCRKVMEKEDLDLNEIKEVQKFLKDNRIEVGVVKPGSDLDATVKATEEKIRKSAARGEGEEILKLFPNSEALLKNLGDATDA